MKTKGLGSDSGLTWKYRAEIKLLRTCKTAANKGGAGVKSAKQSEGLIEVSSSSSYESKCYLRDYASSVTSTSTNKF